MAELCPGSAAWSCGARITGGTVASVSAERCWSLGATAPAVSVMLVAIETPCGNVLIWREVAFVCWQEPGVDMP